MQARCSPISRQRPARRSRFWWIPVADRARRGDRTRDDGPKPPAGERSRQRYAQRRTEVVDTAARVFAARGFHGTTIEDLVEATGLQRGASTTTWTGSSTS